MSIKSRVSTKQYRDNWDKVFKKPKKQKLLIEDCQFTIIHGKNCDCKTKITCEVAEEAQIYSNKE